MTYKVGDQVVVKITKYKPNNVEQPALKRVTETKPAWVVATYVDKIDYDVDHEQPLIVPHYSDEECEALDWDGRYSLVGSIDTYEIVPTDKLPDKVLVALAKRALLGDTE